MSSVKTFNDIVITAGADTLLLARDVRVTVGLINKDSLTEL